MNIPFGPDFLKRYHEALERQKRRKMERRARGRIDFSEMTQEQRLEYIKSSPSALKFLEKDLFLTKTTILSKQKRVITEMTSKLTLKPIKADDDSMLHVVQSILVASNYSTC